MLGHLEMAAARRVGERDDPLDARRRLVRQPVEQAVDDRSRAVLDRQQLDAHRTSRVVAAPDDARLLQHPDEDTRIAVVPDRGGDGFGVDGAAAVAQHAVDAAQQVGGRHVPQREAAERRGIGVAGEKHGVARRAVPARATDHLDVALERVGEVDERDEPHVGLVDPHPEGGRRDHDGRPSRDECLLDARPLLRLEPGVVVLGADAVTDEHSCDLLAGSPGAGVDDRGAVEPAQPAEQRPQALLAVLRALDVVAEVRSVDARAHDLERPAERLGDRRRRSPEWPSPSCPGPPARRARRARAG